MMGHGCVVVSMLNGMGGAVGFGRRGSVLPIYLRHDMRLLRGCVRTPGTRPAR